MKKLFCCLMFFTAYVLPSDLEMEECELKRQDELKEDDQFIRCNYFDSGDLSECRVFLLCNPNKTLRRIACTILSKKMYQDAMYQDARPQAFCDGILWKGCKLKTGDEHTRELTRLLSEENCKQSELNRRSVHLVIGGRVSSAVTPLQLVKIVLGSNEKQFTGILRAYGAQDDTEQGRNLTFSEATIPLPIPRSDIFVIVEQPHHASDDGSWGLVRLYESCMQGCARLFRSLCDC